MENQIIKLELKVKHVNLILAHLSKGIYAEVIEAINLITGQGNPQIAVYQKEAAEAAGKAVGEAIAEELDKQAEEKLTTETVN